MSANPSSSSRPLSPHLSIWRWHATMAASISHRASGSALYVGSLVLVGLLIAAASGEAAYGAYMAYLTAWYGQIILLGFTAALTYHFANGVRHLIWDGPGAGFSPKIASLVSLFNFVFAIAATAALWIIAYTV